MSENNTSVELIETTEETHNVEVVEVTPNVESVEVVEEISCNVVPCSFHRESATVTWVWNTQKT